MKRKYINEAVYIVFDGTSHYGLFGCDVEDAMLDDEDIKVVAGPYKEWPDAEIEQMNDEM